jgi:exonuclease VII large subunit
MNSRIIKSVVRVSENDLIDTRFSDGSVKSKVLKKKQDTRNKTQE